MITPDIFQSKKELEVSMTLWNKWLYRRLLYFSTPTSWSIGVLDLCAGRNEAQKLGVGTIQFYVLSGEGYHEHGHKNDFFSTGAFITPDPAENNDFICDIPARLLMIAASGRTTDFRVALQTLATGKTMSARAICHYVISGTVELSIGHDQRHINSTTAFSIAQGIDYNLINVGKKDALILDVEASTAVNREKYPARGAPATNGQ